MPVICSRMHPVDRVDALLHGAEQRPHPRTMMQPTTPTSTGTTTSSSADSGTSWRSARMMPPTHMIGADTISVNVISTSIWTCCTSLVVRVISDGAPNWPTSRAENVCTRAKMRGPHVAAERHRGAGAEVDGARSEQAICTSGDGEHARRRCA